jgi:hypothetical protein
MSYCWRSLKYARCTFGIGLKNRLASVLVPTKLTSPAVSLLVMWFGGDGLSILVRWAYIIPMERIDVWQNHRDHHEAGGQES